MPSFTNKVEDFFKKDGALSTKVENYSPREQQIEMSLAIVEAIENSHNLVIEAATGVGKTFAYLIPAILSDKKVIVATATRNLQDQLINKDLPLIDELIKIKDGYGVLKGRENYVCDKRYQQAKEEVEQMFNWKTFNILDKWLNSNKDFDDISKCDVIGPKDKIWSEIKARSLFCKFNDCKNGNCSYPNLKKKVFTNQLLVVNHHLLATDLASRINNDDEILPEADLYIIDEAHSFADILGNFLGINLSYNSFIEFDRNLKRAYKDEEIEIPPLLDALGKFVASVEKLNSMLMTFLNVSCETSIKKNLNGLNFDLDLNFMLEDIAYLKTYLEEAGKKSKTLEILHEELKIIELDLKVWIETLDDDSSIKWVEVHNSHFFLNLTPISIAKTFLSLLDGFDANWMFVSATLSFNGKCDYFLDNLGLKATKSMILKSPFDYQKQILNLVLPFRVNPNEADFTKLWLRDIWGLLKKSKGRSFLLFTSYRAMETAYEILSEHWDGEILMQGKESKQKLIDLFRQEEKKNILLATYSFWEGVDIRGDALKIVVIDKIPFASPDDPVLSGKIKFYQDKGQNAFMHLQVPEATQKLKQGIGRLIRDYDDKGVLVICDPRLYSKFYGNTIIQNLPNFCSTKNLNEAINFLD